MTGIDAAAASPRRPATPRRVRLPASRGGIAWLVVLLVVGGFLGVQFGRQVYANWEIGQRADAIRAQITAVEAENTELERELEYLNSPAWIGAEARRLTNVGAPGEQVLIIPEGAEEPLAPAAGAAGAQDPPLLQQWLDLFFGGN